MRIKNQSQLRSYLRSKGKPFEVERKIDTSLITDLDFDGVDFKDYPDFTDAYISGAVWSDTGKELSEKELDLLKDEHADWLYERLWSFLY